MKKFDNNYFVMKFDEPFNMSWLNLNTAAKSIEKLTGSTLVLEFKRAQEGLNYNAFCESLADFGYMFADAVKEYKEVKKMNPAASFSEFVEDYTCGSAIYDEELENFINKHTFEAVQFLAYDFKGLDFRQFFKFTEFGTVQAAPAIVDALNCFALQLMAEAINFEQLSSEDAIQEALTVLLYEFALTPSEIVEQVSSIMQA